METTIFIGNGFNRCTKKNQSWDDLLTEISSEHNVIINDELSKNLYTFLYERVVLSPNHIDDIKVKEESIKTSIAKKMFSLEPIDLYKMIINLNASNFITTNYDYSINNTFIEDEYSVNPGDTSEDVYNIRRHYTAEKKPSKRVKIWQIHGELEKPKTIMLGLDHYCGSIGKMDSYLKGTYSFTKDKNSVVPKKIVEKMIGNEQYDNYSWIELFFNTNVHIIAFSLDYSETDLWWILNKRARLIKELNLSKTNEIFFYGEVDNTKENMLKDFGVQVIRISCVNNDYYHQNIDAIEALSKLIKQTSSNTPF